MRPVVEKAVFLRTTLEVTRLFWPQSVVLEILDSRREIMNIAPFGVRHLLSPKRWATIGGTGGH